MNAEAPAPAGQQVPEVQGDHGSSPNLYTQLIFPIKRMKLQLPEQALIKQRLT